MVFLGIVQPRKSQEFTDRLVQPQLQFLEITGIQIKAINSRSIFKILHDQVFLNTLREKGERVHVKTCTKKYFEVKQTLKSVFFSVLSLWSQTTARV